MNTDLVKRAVDRLRDHGCADDRDTDAGMAMGPAIREAVEMLENYLLLRAAAGGAAADRAKKQEQMNEALRDAWLATGDSRSEPGDDSYAGLLAMVRRSWRRRQENQAAFNEAKHMAGQFLRDAGVPVHRDDLVRVLRAMGTGVGADFTPTELVEALSLPCGHAAGHKVPGGIVYSDSRTGVFGFQETKP